MRRKRSHIGQSISQPMNTQNPQDLAALAPLPCSSVNAAIAEIAAIAGKLSLFGHEHDGQKILTALEVLALNAEGSRRLIGEAADELENYVNDCESYEAPEEVAHLKEVASRCREHSQTNGD